MHQGSGVWRKQQGGENRQESSSEPMMVWITVLKGEIKRKNVRTYWCLDVGDCWFEITLTEEV